MVKIWPLKEFNIYDGWIIWGTVESYYFTTAKTQWHSTSHLTQSFNPHNEVGLLRCYISRQPAFPTYPKSFDSLYTIILVLQPFLPHRCMRLSEPPVFQISCLLPTFPGGSVSHPTFLPLCPNPTPTMGSKTRLFSLHQLVSLIFIQKKRDLCSPKQTQSCRKTPKLEWQNFTTKHLSLSFTFTFSH